MNIFLEIIASDKKEWPESRFLVIFNVLIFGQKFLIFSLGKMPEGKFVAKC